MNDEMQVFVILGLSFDGKDMAWNVLLSRHVF